MIGIKEQFRDVIGFHDDLLTMVKKRKLIWYGRFSRSSVMGKRFCKALFEWARRRGRQIKRSKTGPIYIATRTRKEQLKTD